MHAYPDLNRELEQTLLREVSADEMWRHAAALSQWQRMSGTEDEAAAAAYVADVLGGYQVSVTVAHFDSLLGYPGAAALSVLTPKSLALDCITHPFSGATLGLEAQLVYVANVTSASLKAVAVAGKVVITEGLAVPFKFQLIQESGAVAAVFINDTNLHDMCLSPVWGTPTPASAKRLPTIPCLSILGKDGCELKDMLKSGSVAVRMRVQPRLEWERVPLVMGEVRGGVEPDKFVMFSGHLCSWYYGATDNAGANAAMIEIARLLSRHRGYLRRSVKVVFWPGHTQGRYSGSTWYADNFWEEVYQGCVLHVNVDSIGAKGATIYRAPCMAETRDYVLSIIEEVTGKKAEPERMPRAGDQSFWGLGVPSALMTLSLVPPELMTELAAAVIDASGGATAPQAGLPWWWHTPHDTLDKLDRDILALDTKIYLLTVLRAATCPILPLDYESTAEELLALLSDLQRKAGTAFDLAPVLAKAELLRAKTAELGKVAARLGRNADRLGERSSMVAEINRCLMQLGRCLIPVSYTLNGPYEQDPATPIPPLPGLQAVAQLHDMSPDSDAFRCLATELVRQRNRVVHALTQAIEAVSQTLERVS